MSAVVSLKSLLLRLVLLLLLAARSAHGKHRGVAELGSSQGNYVGAVRMAWRVCEQRIRVAFETPYEGYAG